MATKQKHTNDVPALQVKMLPAQVAAEKEIIGICMVVENAVYEALEIIKPEHFYIDAHQQLFSVIRDLHNRSNTVQVATVVEEMRRRGFLDRPMSAFDITVLTNSVSSSAGLTERCIYVLDAYMNRQLMNLSAHVYNESAQGVHWSELSELINTTQDKLWSHIHGMKKLQYDVLIYNQLNTIISNDGSKPIGLLTLFPSLDRILLAFIPGQLYVIAARPSMGKTAFMVQLAENFSKQAPGGIIELESSTGAFTRRHLANISGVSTELLQRGGLDKEQQQRVYDASEKIMAKGNIYCDFDPLQDTARLTRIIRAWVKKYNCKWVLIDYLQIISATTEEEKLQRERQVSKQAQTLAALAVALDIVIIPFAQLSRETLKRAGNVPNLGDLRESGGIEAAARVVMFIHRPEYYDILEDEFGESTRGIAEIIVAKNNEGVTGKARLNFQGHLSRYTDPELEPNASNGWKAIVDLDSPF